MENKSKADLNNVLLLLLCVRALVWIQHTGGQIFQGGGSVGFPPENFERLTVSCILVDFCSQQLLPFLN